MMSAVIPFNLPYHLKIAEERTVLKADGVRKLACDDEAHLFI